MKYGQKCGGKNRKIGLTFFPQKSSNFFFIERQKISPQTKYSKTTLLPRAAQWVKLPFFPKKCIFWPENDIFSKKSLYSKLISDENYLICTCQKKHFQKKIMSLQFSPDSTYLCSTSSLTTKPEAAVSALGLRGAVTATKQENNK